MQTFFAFPLRPRHDPFPRQIVIIIYLRRRIRRSIRSTKLHLPVSRARQHHHRGPESIDDMRKLRMEGSDHYGIIHAALKVDLIFVVDINYQDVSSLRPEFT